MIVKDEFLSKLRQAFNLNIYEVKIWTALLSRGISTAGELSDISDVPRSRSYDVLESLEKKGFIIMKLGKPIQYLAVPPEEVVKRMKTHVNEHAKVHLDLLDKVKTEPVYDELEVLFKTGITFVEPESLSGSFKGRDNIYAHLEAMLRNAKKSITIVTTADGLKRKSVFLKPVLSRAKNKGIRVRIAAPLSKLLQSELKSLSEVAELKHLDGKVNARFAVVDGKEVLFMVMNDNSVHENYDVGIWANTPFFASALENMFETTWKSLQTNVLKK